MLERVSETGGSSLVERAKTMATDLRQWKAWGFHDTLHDKPIPPPPHTATHTRTNTNTPPHTQHGFGAGGRGRRRGLPDGLAGQGSPEDRSTPFTSRKNDESHCYPHPGLEAGGQQSWATGTVADGEEEGARRGGGAAAEAAAQHNREAFGETKRTRRA